MAYCSDCGKALGEDAKFCGECGKSAAPPEKPLGPASPPHATGVVAREPKRGGRLALKGFALSFVLGVIAATATRNETPTQLVAIGIAYGASAAYIAIKLRIWKQHGELVKGATVSWTVAILLLFTCVAILMSALGVGREDSATNDRSVPASSVPAKSTFVIDPKKVLLNNVALDFRWHREGLGNFMLADFTIRNPTQYRFKDFEITCDHSAPSGTVIDSNTRTIYEIVEPVSEKIVKQVDMGLIHNQAQTSDCKITDLVPLP